jgi:hypothetical protein
MKGLPIEATWLIECIPGGLPSVILFLPSPQFVTTDDSPPWASLLYGRAPFFVALIAAAISEALVFIALLWLFVVLVLSIAVLVLVIARMIVLARNR